MLLWLRQLQKEHYYVWCDFFKMLCIHYNISQVIGVLCSVGGVVLVAVFSQEDEAQSNSTSSSNHTDSSGHPQIRETPLGYVVSEWVELVYHTSTTSVNVLPLPLAMEGQVGPPFHTMRAPNPVGVISFCMVQ